MVLAILELFSGGQPGHVIIRGRASKLYVAMNKKGRLYGEVNNIINL